MEIGNKRIEFENLKETLTVKIFPYIKTGLKSTFKNRGLHRKYILYFTSLQPKRHYN